MVWLLGAAGGGGAGSRNVAPGGVCHTDSHAHTHTRAAAAAAATICARGRTQSGPPSAAARACGVFEAGLGEGLGLSIADGRAPRSWGVSEEASSPTPPGAAGGGTAHRRRGVRACGRR